MLTRTKQRWGPKQLLLTAATLGFVVVELDVTAVNIALQQIGASFGAGVTGLEWVVNAYKMAFAAMIILAGALTERFGAKRLFIAGFALFSAASLGCGLAPNLGVLIVVRAMEGAGAAILIPCSLALFNHASRGDQNPEKTVGVWRAGPSVALAAGPVVGGVLIANIGWRSVFLINLPIGVLGIWLMWRYVGETNASPDRRFDLIGQLLATLAFADLVAVMAGGDALGWIHPIVLAGLALFGVIAAAFRFIEVRVENPMMQLYLFYDRTFSTATTIGWLINLVFYGLIFVLGLFFQRTQHYSALGAGLAFLPMTGMLLVTNRISGRVKSALNARFQILIGLILMAAGCLALAPIDYNTPYWKMAGQMMAIGAGLGLAAPAMTRAFVGTVGRFQFVIASGVLNTVRQTGSVAGVAIFGSLIARQDHLVNGLRISLAISASLLVISCILAFLMPKADPAPS
jgi:DHA2 family methylenomycin A resistance protein-like MFS transporter